MLHDFAVTSVRPAARPTRPRLAGLAPVALDLLAPIALAVLALLAPLATAHAHQRLVSSSPASGDTLEASPDELRLTFSARVVMAFSAIELLDSNGGAVAVGPLRSPADSSSVLVASVAGPLAPGRYIVAWRTAGADGHPVRGRFEFVVGSAVPGIAAALPDSSATAGAGGDDTLDAHAGHEVDSIPPAGESDTSTDSPIQVVVRWLTFAALLGVIGVAAFRWLVLRAVAPFSTPALAIGAERGARRLGLLLVVSLLVAVLARLVAQWAALGGVGAETSMGSVLATTQWGWGWMLQLLGASTALAGLLLARRSRGAWAIVLGAAFMLGVSPALSGHAAATGALAPVTIAADAAHVLGAGAWIGTLLVLVLAGLPATLALPSGERGSAAALLVNRFSPVALGAATLLVLSGAVSAWAHLGSLAALLGTTYGRTLVVKLALVVLVAALGAFHWRRARPALGTEDSARSLRRSAAAELAIAALVLVVTAILVATPPPASEF